MKRINWRLCLVLLCLASQLPAQPNIIYLIADDLGADYCGFYNLSADTANMPHIGGLLSRGVLFPNAWATPLCSPTRAGLLTGRYSFRTGVGTAISGPGYAQIDPAETTLPALLRTYAGYTTASMGKWHLSQQTPQNLSIPNQMGYDWYSGNFLGELGDYFNWKKIVNGVAVSPNITRYATTETVDDAINWLNTVPANKPFFLWMAFNAPHTPFHVPPADLHTVPGLTGAQGHINQNPTLYFKAMIEALDTETGRLFVWLQQNDRWENTYIVFIGDNGNTKRVSQLADTTHAKGTLYEYGVRVPFLIAGPGIQQPGRTSTALVSTPDLFATGLELAGLSDWQNLIPANKPVDAQSLLPLLLAESTTGRNWIFTEVFSPTPDPDDGKAIRNQTHKLIRFDNGNEALYQLVNDPNEQNNLLDQLPLESTAASNYQMLCQQLNDLLGLPTCTLVDTDESAPDTPDDWIVPMPVGQVLTWKYSLEGDWSFEIFNSLGQSMASGTLTPATLDVAHWPPGWYVARRSNGRQADSILFLKQ